MATGIDNANTVDWLNYALFEVWRTGRFDRIFLRYFPISPYSDGTEG